MKTRRNSGFTLVEILIVVIILGILAAVVIPQFTDASTRAKDSTLVSNIQTLQSQFELYKMEHNDIYPWDDPATAGRDVDGSAAIIARLTSLTDADGTINAAGAFGPYMQEWGYEFPVEWGDESVQWLCHLEYRITVLIRNLYWRHLRWRIS